MIEVAKTWEGVRQEGLNFGLPMFFLKLGIGSNFEADELVKTIITSAHCRWVYIFGDETTKIGMGSLVKGLSAVGLSTEIEVGGNVRDPGWIHTVDRWVVNYVENASFNYGALRGQDMIRFQVNSESDIRFVAGKLEDLRMFPGTKVLKLNIGDENPDWNPQLFQQILLLAGKYDRCRLYW